MQTTIETNPKSESLINYQVYKRRLVMAFSLIIMIWGLYGIGQQIKLLVNILPLLEKSTYSLLSDAQVYRYLLKYILFTSIVHFVTTAYGLALIVKPTHLVKTAHFIVGALLILVNIYVNSYLGISALTVAKLLHL